MALRTNVKSETLSMQSSVALACGGPDSGSRAARRPPRSGQPLPVPSAWKSRPQEARRSAELFQKHAEPEGPSISLPRGVGLLENGEWALERDGSVRRLQERLEPAEEPTVILQCADPAEAPTVIDLDLRRAAEAVRKFRSAPSAAAGSSAPDAWKRIV